MEKILVIEDEKDALENICKILELEGYKPIAALNGDQGIELILKEKPDLVICDLGMPGTNGYEVLEEVKKNSKISTIPFIFLTAYSNKDNVVKGLELGAQDYISKPFDSRELIIRAKNQLRIKCRLDYLNYMAQNLQEEIKNFFNPPKPTSK